MNEEKMKQNFGKSEYTLPIVSIDHIVSISGVPYLPCLAHQGWSGRTLGQPPILWDYGHALLVGFRAYFPERLQLTLGLLISLVNQRNSTFLVSVYYFVFATTLAIWT